ncbi:shikimate dehydrogenase, putative [Hepatocystis sp. ex Piliocolobus tephrosceles]|nr:shikimate dehydrogenase, putative [Hepatocystis sp. ex Piliocolobus tephrosceles]
MNLISEDNKLKCKNVVLIYTIRMYLNGLIIGYVFRKEIYKNFYLCKNNDVIYNSIKKTFGYINNKVYKNPSFLLKYDLHKNKYIYNKLNSNISKKKNYYIYKFIPLHKLSNLKTNIQVSNFFALRLSFWTLFCSLTCWNLNKSLDNSIICPTISGFIASSLNKMIFKEHKKPLIPIWLGCILSNFKYVIF